VSTGSPMWCGSGDELALLIEAGTRLIPDVAVYVIADTPTELREAAAAIEGAGLEFGGWKGFADGSLGGHTALLRQPYGDRPDTRGLDRWAPSTMRTMAAAALELGGNVAIHAIGDAAVERAVDLAADLDAEKGRFRIEHASVVDRPLIERMAEGGIVASVQPAFIASDAPFLRRRLGPDRARHAYPFRSMIEAGVAVIAGSDAPIETPDPLAGMAAAMHRPGMADDEALDREAALAIHSAHTGRPGDPADLAVIRPSIDGGGRVAATIVRGEVVQERRRRATSDS
jgi:predicted amidohydrolase YtcJ